MAFGLVGREIRCLMPGWYNLEVQNGSRSTEGVGTYLIYFVDNGLHVAPFVADSYTNHHRKFYLEFMSEDGIGYGPFATDVDRIDQQFVVITATADQVYEVGAGNRALAFEIINQVLVEELN